MKYLCKLLLASCLAILPAVAFPGDLAQQRNNFLLAEKLIGQGNEKAFSNISLTLVDYPLYPYLQYQWLKDHVEQTGKILAFLQTYPDTRYAGLLRTRWLTYLGKQKRWQEYIKYYQANGSTALECGFYWANYNTGNKQLALNVAKRLWTVGQSQPGECDPLFSALEMSPLFTSDLIWQRFELALKENNVNLANHIRRMLNQSDLTLADLWLKVHENPDTIQDIGFWGSKYKRLGRIFVHGVDRMAKTDLESAVMTWDANKHNTAFDSQDVQTIERRLGLALAHSRRPGAYDRLNRLLSFDKEVREWKVRAALYEQDWRHIAEAVSNLTLEELKEPIWQYWHARSLAANGDMANARKVYTKLAEDRSFYGFLAADAVGRPYNFQDKPVSLAVNALEMLAAETDFQVVKELKNLNREVEAKRQWWYAIKKLGNERRALAAKLAQHWNWDQVAIITLVKADYWDDLGLRFPLDYLTQIQSNAYRQDLDPAVVYGVIRQESMLDSAARSPAGARGLMQIMPKTAKQIARELNERWQSERSLFDPDVNIQYGSYYFKKLLNRFNGHVALATAAYNAGPGRVSKWLPFGRSVPADIWVETIPYRETRKYVASVLSYIIIYQHRIKRGALKMKDFMRDILPG